MLWVLDVFLIPSGLQPNSIKVSGHSQLPVKGLKARPKQKGVMLVFQDFKMNRGQKRITWVTWVPIKRNQGTNTLMDGMSFNYAHNCFLTNRVAVLRREGLGEGFGSGGSGRQRGQGSLGGE